MRNGAFSMTTLRRAPWITALSLIHIFLGVVPAVGRGFGANRGIGVNIVLVQPVHLHRKDGVQQDDGFLEFAGVLDFLEDRFLVVVQFFPVFSTFASRNFALAVRSF